MTERESRRAIGMRVRREVLGDAHVDRAVAGTTPLSARLQELITEVAWGEVWSGPELDRKTRSTITVAVLAALGQEAELALHVRGALRNGLTAEEISAVLVHTSIYAGIPAARGAIAVAERVLDEVAREEASRSEGSPT